MNLGQISRKSRWGIGELARLAEMNSVSRARVINKELNNKISKSLKVNQDEFIGGLHF